MDQHTPPTVSAICEVVGRQAIASAVGVGLTAVSNAASENRFPARWFYAVRALCAESGIQCPERLFSFAGIDNSSAGAA
ncbi:hypothetical protein [Paracoccus nototheniae]|uniref:Transcriptional regulator n=1 Tax=Paracoccus nototheniae TaxID=2489002 RepID=A0ABW4DZT1_9RHOB|nr:hypothetical protein [Paracoccus nototheniae]